MKNIGGLLLSLSKSHRGILAEKLAKIDLYPGQDGLIYHLSVHDGQTMSELIEKLSIQHPTLFATIERMEKAGLLSKKKDKEDKRSSRIYLTEQGKAKLAELSVIWKNLEKQLLKGFNAEEKVQAFTILNKLNNNLK